MTSRPQSNNASTVFGKLCAKLKFQYILWHLLNKNCVFSGLLSLQNLNETLQMRYLHTFLFVHIVFVIILSQVYNRTAFIIVCTSGRCLWVDVSRRVPSVREDVRSLWTTCQVSARGERLSSTCYRYVVNVHTNIKKSYVEYVNLKKYWVELGDSSCIGWSVYRGREYHITIRRNYRWNRG